MRVGLCLLVLVLAGLPAGCGGVDRTPITSPREDFFAPRELRLHPIFTRVTDWTGDDVPDGIEANLELLDFAGEPVKAAGVAVFELYAYDERSPTARGERIANPWTGRLDTAAQQQAHWERTTRTYRFQLANPGISRDRTYVLLASFRPIGQERLFDELILGGIEEVPAAPPPPSVSPNTPAQSQTVPERLTDDESGLAAPVPVEDRPVPEPTTRPADPWMFLPQDDAASPAAEAATQPAPPQPAPPQPAQAEPTQSEVEYVK